MRIITLAILILSSKVAFTQTPNIMKGDLFDKQDLLQITLTYDIERLKKDKVILRDTGASLSGTLTLNEKSMTVEVAPRGKGSFNCPQPQLRLNFKNAATADTPFAGFGKLKLFKTGLCLSNDTNSENDKTILSNYLIYKLYEKVFPFSFRTRLVQMTYIDSVGQSPTYTQMAFFLEPESTIGSQLKLTYVEQQNLLLLGMEKLPSLIDASQAQLMHAFQFFIGNFDYGIPGLFGHIQDGAFAFEKNVLLYQNTDGKLFPVAYDFDFSRFVYRGPYCNFSITFFNDNNFLLKCPVPELVKKIKSDLEQFRYSKDVQDNFPKIKTAVVTWRSENAQLISELGPTYSADLDLYLQAFEEALKN